MKVIHSIFVFCLLLLYLGIGSCSKSSELGLSLVEDTVADIQLETLDVELSTVIAEKSITSSNGFRNSVVCGKYIDPIFGVQKAEGHLNFRPSKIDVKFSSAVTFDSLILVLPYSTVGHYGDVLDTSSNSKIQTWDVWRLSDDILGSENYKSDAILNKSTAVASAYSFNANYRDSLVLNGETIAPQIRIPLSAALGNELLFPTDTTVYDNNLNFKAFFKGIAISPNSTGVNSSILRLRLRSSVGIKMILYYTESGENKTFEYLTDEDIEFFSYFEQDHSNTAVFNTVDTLDYMQGLDGLSTRIDLTALSNMENILINKAELLLPVADQGSVHYPLPGQIIANKKLTATDFDLLEDVLSSLNSSVPYTSFGGSAILDTLTQKPYYKVSISEFAQKIVDGEAYEAAIYLNLASVLDPDRLVFSNQNAFSSKPKIRLTYTKIN